MMEMRDYVMVVMRRWRVLLASVVVVVLTAALLSAILPPRFVASTTLRVSTVIGPGGESVSYDSIMYVTLREAHELDGKYNVIGHILSGMPVVRATQVGDVIRRVSVTP